MKVWLLIAANLIICVSFAQDTAKLEAAQALMPKVNTYMANEYLLKSKRLFYKPVTGSITHSTILYNPALKEHLSFDSCEYFLGYSLQIDSCTFLKRDDAPPVEDCMGNDTRLKLLGGYSIRNSTFDSDLTITHTNYSTSAGSANVNSNTAESITISDNSVKLFTIINNKVKKGISVSYNKAESLLLLNNQSTDRNSSAYIGNSTYKIGCSIIDNQVDRIMINECEISGNLIIHYSDVYQNERGKSKHIRIKDTFINAKCTFLFDKELYRSKVSFENCSFGPNASILSMAMDTIEFINCPNINYPLFMTVDTSRTQVALQLVNSNMSNLKFDYTEKFKLFFDSSATADTRSNTYQGLFAKYSVEGKTKNIEKIDIEYKRYQYSENWILYPIWLLDYVWWRYGYSKWLIIAWTIVLLSIFCLYNFRNWEGMRKIYGVFDKDDLSTLGHGPNRGRVIKKALYTLVFTSFIFFSLRVDFDKLRYANNKFLLAFFIQYIVGLICLFFLVNAIFKL